TWSYGVVLPQGRNVNQTVPKVCDPRRYDQTLHPWVIYLTSQLLTNVISPIPTMIERRRYFEREAMPWIDDVHRFALSLTRDEADADDVVQDTYLRALKSWHTYVPGSDCRRW